MRRKIMIIFSLLVGITGARSEEAKRLYNQTVKVSYMNQYCTAVEAHYFPLEDLRGLYMKPNSESSTNGEPDYGLALETTSMNWNANYCGFDKSASIRRYFQIGLIGSRNWEISGVDSDSIIVDYEAYGWDAQTTQWYYPAPEPGERGTRIFSGRDSYTSAEVRVTYVGNEEQRPTTPVYLIPYSRFFWGFQNAFISNSDYSNEVEQVRGEALQISPNVNDTVFNIKFSRKSIVSMVERYNTNLLYMPLMVTGEEAVKSLKIIARKNLINIPQRTIVDVTRDDLKDFTLKVPVEIRQPLKYGCTILFANHRTSHVSVENSVNEKEQLTAMPYRNYEIVSGGGLYIPAGAKKVDLTIRIIDDNPQTMLESERKYAIPFEITMPRTKPGVVFDEGTPVEYQDSVINILSRQIVQVFFAGINIKEPNRLKIDPEKVSFPDIEKSEGSIGELFDDDLSTYCHSSWTKVIERSEPYGSYMDIELDKEIKSVYFQMSKRTAESKAPKDMAIYVSNDGKNWTLLTKIALVKPLRNGESEWIGSAEEPFTAETPFKYIRWCVLTNDKGEKLTQTSSGIHWSLAELHFFGK